LRLMLKQQAGFSLLELILVVLLISILMLIAVPNLFAAMRVAREGRAVANLRSLVNVQIQFYGSLGRFGIFDEFYKRNFLFPGQFVRGSDTGGTSGPAEVVSDSAYEY